MHAQIGVSVGAGVVYHADDHSGGIRYLGGDGDLTNAGIYVPVVIDPGIGQHIYSVIFQEGQFEPVSSGIVYNTPTDDCWAAAKLALEGVRPVGDSLYFAAFFNCWAGNNRIFYRQIQGHYFWL